MKSLLLKKFGLRIKDLRIQKGISQEKLAELANFHRTYIGMIERGERNLSLTNIEKFAKVFKVTIKDLFDF